MTCRPGGAGSEPAPGSAGATCGRAANDGGGGGGTSLGRSFCAASAAALDLCITRANCKTGEVHAQGTFPYLWGFHRCIIDITAWTYIYIHP